MSRFLEAIKVLVANNDAIKSPTDMKKVLRANGFADILSSSLFKLLNEVSLEELLTAAEAAQ